MKKPCGTAEANIVDSSEINGVFVCWGTGFNPNLTHYFVAWGQKLNEGDFISTYNDQTSEKGQIWYLDEEEAEKYYEELKSFLTETSFPQD